MSVRAAGAAAAVVAEMVGDGLCAQAGEARPTIAIRTGSVIFMTSFLVEVRGSSGNPGTLSGRAAKRSLRICCTGGEGKDVRTDESSILFLNLHGGK